MEREQGKPLPIFRPKRRILEGAINGLIELELKVKKSWEKAKRWGHPMVDLGHPIKA